MVQGVAKALCGEVWGEDGRDIQHREGGRVTRLANHQDASGETKEGKVSW